MNFIIFLLVVVSGQIKINEDLNDIVLRTFCKDPFSLSRALFCMKNPYIKKWECIYDYCISPFSLESNIRS